MTYLYDTDHVTILQRRAGPEYAAVLRNAARHPSADIGYPVISFHEQVLGAHALINRARTPAELLRGYILLGETLAVYTAVPVVPVDAPALTEFDALRALGVRIGTLDLRIAAIARSRNLVVVTRSTADFGRVPGLVTEDWTK